MKKRSNIFIIVKVLLLQIFFYFTSKYGPLGYGEYFFYAGSVLMLLNFLLIKDLINLKPYLGLMLIFFITGFVQDTVFIYFDIIKLDSTFPPIWFPTLWLMFLGYYGDVFNKMMDFSKYKSLNLTKRNITGLKTV